MNNNICGNCKFFNNRKQMINGKYMCMFHGFPTNYNDIGCYKIQFYLIK